MQSPLALQPNLRQHHVQSAQLGPPLTQQNTSDWVAFLERSPIYDAYDIQSGRCFLPDNGPSTMSALRTTMVTGPPISLDIPPSLANFRIAGGHTSCEWSDTAQPLFYQQQLHYTYTTSDKSPSSPHLSSSHSYCIDLPTSSDMVLPSASPPLSSTPAIPGPSTTTPAVEITQSIRTACASSSRSAPSRNTKGEGSASRPREKKHACWMCEKSFDRPSTLRKVGQYCSAAINSQLMYDLSL
jgi:hypothetical protein